MRIFASTKGRADRRGFTLIEQMICLAILAIVFGQGFLQFHRTVEFFNREQNYRLALGMMRRAAVQVRAMRFDDLPPYIVPTDRTLPAGALAARMIPGTRRVATLRGAHPLHLLSYDFEVAPGGGEAARVDAAPPYAIHLMNAPVREVLDVVRLDAPGHPRLQPRLRFGRSLAGAVVTVDYLGAIRIVASSRFLDAGLRPSQWPGPAKAVTLRAYDGPERQPALDVVLVKMR